jgi:hypothetical protein
MSTLSKIRDSAKDWSIKGFQLQKTYLDDWEYMKKIFFIYGLDINIHGPILTLAESKNVRYARYMTEIMSKDFKLIEKKEIFLTIMRIFTKYARIQAEKQFKKFIKENLLDLVEVARNGSLKDSDERLELRMREILNGK